MHELARFPRGALNADDPSMSGILREIFIAECGSERIVESSLHPGTLMLVSIQLDRDKMVHSFTFMSHSDVHDVLHIPVTICLLL